MEKTNNEYYVKNGLAYVCGCLYAAGSVAHDRRTGNYVVSLETSSRDVAEAFASCFNCFSSKQATVRESGRGSFAVRVYSKKDVQLIMSLGFREGVPEECFRDSGFRRAFLRGVLDSKATIRKRVASGKRRVTTRIFSTKEEILRALQELFRKEGISSSVYRTGRQLCLDIDGKAKNRSVLERIGFFNRNKENELRAWISESGVNPALRGDEVYMNST